MHKLNALVIVFGIFLTVSIQPCAVASSRSGACSRHEAPIQSWELELTGAKLKFVPVRNFYEFTVRQAALRRDPKVKIYSLRHSLVNKCVVPNGDIYLRFKPGVSNGERQLLLLAHGLKVVTDYRVERYHYYQTKCSAGVDPVSVAAKMQAESASKLALVEPDFYHPGKFND